MKSLPVGVNQDRRAPDKYRLLFEHSADAHFIMIDGVITDCNDAAIQLLKGKCRKDILSIPHIAELSPEYQPDGSLSSEKSAEMDKLAREKGYHRFEWIHQKCDGETFPVDVTLNAIEINGKPALIAVWHDLTERKRQEAALRQAHQKMKEDLEAAALIQQSLLPVKTPLVKGLRTAWTFKPSEELGGDILNVFTLDEKHVGFYVLDAAGHGVGASLLSVSVAHFLSPLSEVSLLRCEKNKIRKPFDVAQRLNQHYCSNPEATQLFTLLYGILNMETLEFSYVCAGHLSPILLSGTKTKNLPGSSGPPIGVLNEVEYTDTVIQLEQAQRLYLYSDGLTEAKNKIGDQFGETRFLELLADQCDTALSRTTEKIIREIEQWCSPAIPTDDISLLAFDIVPQI